MPLLSGSVAELGPNARTLTWDNSKRYAEAYAELSISLLMPTGELCRLDF